MELTRQELDLRLEKFIKLMNTEHPDWDTAVIISKVNQYYFMGTMQDAFLLIDKNGGRRYHVRRSEDRALDESPLPESVFKMNSYRDAAAMGNELGSTYLELEFVPYAMVNRLQKYFRMKKIGSLDRTLNKTRSIKTPYELFWIETSGRQHKKLLVDVVPTLLREGMSEPEFLGEIKSAMMGLGYQGWSRFQMFQTEGDIGQIGFGANSIYPTSFDGPGGARGNSAAVPLSGNYDSRLKKGDLVFVDVGFGMRGYHTDKTQVFMFGAEPSEEMKAAHEMCLDIQKRTVDLLKPGAVPSEIYSEIVSPLTDEEKLHFMGYGEHAVKFLGHGVGLYIDEYPVIAGGFDEPLAENMVIALEPKKGIEGVGMLGVEETYLIEKDGARVLTGGEREIIVVK